MRVIAYWCRRSGWRLAQLGPAALAALGVLFACALLQQTVVWLLPSLPDALVSGLALLTLLPLVLAAGFILRSAGSRDCELPGVKLKASDAPALFAAIDELRSAARAPAFANVYLTEHLNAAALQRPRGFSLRARPLPDLLFGKPLLKALSGEELRAVLAHELGHVMLGHGALANRYSRLSWAWARVAADRPLCRRADRGRRSIVALLLHRCARRYIDRAFPRYRAAEFEADRFAAGLAGKAAVASALQRIAIEEARHSLAWGQDDSVRSDADILRECLRDTTAGDDTHPCLAERLAALGVAPGLLVG